MNNIDNILLLNSMQNNFIKLLIKTKKEINKLKQENAILAQENSKIKDENNILNNRILLYDYNNYPINRPCGSRLMNIILTNNNSCPTNSFYSNEY